MLKKLSLLALVAFACSPFPCTALDIVAHRGASEDAPENTLPAFELAWEQGADLIEGDFFMTSDTVIVCFHDKTSERIAGQPLDISSTAFEQLRNLDVGAWKDPQWRGTRIPTLAQVLATLPPDRGRMFIEVKDSERIIEPLSEQLAATGVPKSRLAVISFDKAVIKACKKAMPEMDVFWLVGTKTYKKLGTGGVIKTLKKLGADGVDIQATAEITAELGAALRENGLQFHCWTVNDIPLARHMVEIGVDSITTDRPGVLKRALAPKEPSRSRPR
jgi:glycerophosphoryl diester phosphodiesterase